MKGIISGRPIQTLFWPQNVKSAKNKWTKKPYGFLAVAAAVVQSGNSRRCKIFRTILTRYAKSLVYTKVHDRVKRKGEILPDC